LILFSIICMQNLILELYLQRSREALFPRVRKPRDAPASKKVKTDPCKKFSAPKMGACVEDVLTSKH
jgi:hypothetical protein